MRHEEEERELGRTFPRTVHPTCSGSPGGAAEAAGERRGAEDPPLESRHVAAAAAAGGPIAGWLVGWLGTRRHTHQLVAATLTVCARLPSLSLVRAGEWVRTSVTLRPEKDRRSYQIADQHSDINREKVFWERGEQAPPFGNTRYV